MLNPPTAPDSLQAYFSMINPLMTTLFAEPLKAGLAPRFLQVLLPVTERELRQSMPRSEEIAFLIAACSRGIPHRLVIAVGNATRTEFPPTTKHPGDHQSITSVGLCSIVQLSGYDPDREQSA
jgi:hypothetical protein